MTANKPMRMGQWSRESSITSCEYCLESSITFPVRDSKYADVKKVLFHDDFSSTNIEAIADMIIVTGNDDNAAKQFLMDRLVVDQKKRVLMEFYDPYNTSLRYHHLVQAIYHFEPKEKDDTTSTTRTEPLQVMACAVEHKKMVSMLQEGLLMENRDIYGYNTVDLLDWEMDDARIQCMYNTRKNINEVIRKEKETVEDISAWVIFCTCCNTNRKPHRILSLVRFHRAHCIQDVNLSFFHQEYLVESLVDMLWCMDERDVLDLYMLKYGKRPYLEAVRRIFCESVQKWVPELETDIKQLLFNIGELFLQNGESWTKRELPKMVVHWYVHRGYTAFAGSHHGKMLPAEIINSIWSLKGTNAGLVNRAKEWRISFEKRF